MKDLLLLCFCFSSFFAGAQRTVEHLSIGRAKMGKAVTDEYVYFSGGNAGYSFHKEVDVFDASGNVFQVLEMPQGKTMHASTANDSLVFFAGGAEVGGYTNAVYIYNENTAQWSTIFMPHVHSSFTAVLSDGKVYFAGGNDNAGLSDVVDIYDIASNTFTEMHLSLARTNLHGIALNGKIYFAGGRNMGNISDVIDVYDEISGSWSIMHMPVSRDEFGITSDGSMLYFAGGEQGLGNFLSTFSKRMDIYDPVLNTWEATYFKQERRGLDNAMAFGCGRIYLAGGSTPDQKWKILDVYTIATKTWFQDTISGVREVVCCAVLGDKLFAAGGFVASLSYSDAVDVIDVCYDIPEPEQPALDIDGLSTNEIPNVFTPNNDKFNDYWAFLLKTDLPPSVEIYNRWGQLVKTMAGDKAGDFYLIKWDGKTWDGFELSDGAYFYQVTYHDLNSNSNLKLQGFITLLR